MRGARCWCTMRAGVTPVERMVDLNGKLGLHEKFRHAIARIGSATAPVLVVDDFLGDARVMVDFAAAHARFEPSGLSYPGLRAAAPPIYAYALRAFLDKIVRAVFGFGDGEAIIGSCDFALVTTPPRALQTVQRMPHFDSTNDRQIAMVHYLCPAAKGGTSFYRHRRSGFEVIDSTHAARYTEIIREELTALGPPPAAYIDGDDARFERIAAFEAAFNRVLIYRSVNLHSASIAEGFHFDPEPRTGRLTANTILTYR